MIPAWSGVGRRVSRSDRLRARARDGELALVHGCTCSTTLGRWHSGYHGFKPKLTNELGLSCQLSCSPSPAVRSRTGDPVTRREYVPVASTKTSLFSTVTVPPVPGIRRTSAAKYDTVGGRIAPTSPSVSPKAVGANNVAEGECSPVASVLMSASQGRRAGLYPWKDLDAEAAPVESRMSVWRDSELAS